MLRVISFALAALAVMTTRADDPAVRWWKGNLHTHSLWSDGDEFPEMIGDWYKKHGYHFLALTDHNVLSQGERWMRVSDVVKRSDAGVLDRYKERFGDHWVETRGESGGTDFEVKLKPLSEFRHLLEESEQFLFIQAEEISDRAEGKPVHINATNIVEVIPPARGDTVRAAMQNNLRAIIEHGKQHGINVLPHVNHPNFGFAMTAEDLAAVVAEEFFEVYNGHPGVNHLGDDDHPSIERMWDLINAIRRTRLDAPLMMGIAVDDSHEYHGQPGSHPGRGWVMVRSLFLTPEHIVAAIKRGDFYASSGVELIDVVRDGSSGTLRLSIKPEDGVTYRTDFIATLRGDENLGDDQRIGVVVATSTDLRPSYSLTDTELYVRAVVTSSRPHVDPSFEGQKQQAWIQPLSATKH